MTNLPDTLRTLAVLALAIGLPRHAQELEHASRRDGTITILRTFAPCPSGVLLWVLSAEGGRIMGELHAAAEAVQHTATTAETRALAEGIIAGIEAVNVGSALAAAFVRRAAA